MARGVYLQPRPDRRDGAARETLERRVRAEFEQMPSLRLTRAQAQRLFDMSPEVCRRVMAALVADGTLMCGSDGQYALKNTRSQL